MGGLLAAALRYCPRTVPLRVGDKRPAVDDWTNWSATPDTVAQWWHARPNANVGIRCGDGLAVLDVDPRHGGDVSVARIERQFGSFPSTPETATGGGGRHLYFRAPRHVRLIDRLAPGLELKGAGRQVVAPPSIHPTTGRVYCWHPAHPLIHREIAPLPAWLVRLAMPGLSAEPCPRPDHLAERDPLHRIPATSYVPKLTGRLIDRRGYVKCPFHSCGRETVPSLKVYDGGGWKCYGCGVGGRIYQLAGLLGGYTLPLESADRVAIRAELIREFAEDLVR